MVANKYIKKIIIVCLSILMISQFIVPLSANNKIRVGYFHFDGYHELDDDRRSGYGYELLQKLASYNDWTYDYLGYDKSWAQAQTMLENDEIDLLTSAQKTPERLEKFDFSKNSIGYSSTILTVRSNDSRFDQSDFSTYQNIRVGMLVNNSRNTSFDNFALEHNINYIPVYYQSSNDLTYALQEGIDIDAIVTSNLRQIENERILNQFDISPFYVMVKKGNTDLLNKIDYAIEQLDNHSSSWRDDLFNKYYAPKNSSEIAFSISESNYLNELSNSTLKVVVNPDRAPYSYFEDGQAKGIMVDIFKEIASRVNLKYEIIETKNRKEYNDLIDNKDIDLRIDSCLDYSEAENNGYKLTDTYFTTSISKITKKGNDSKESKVSLLANADLTNTYREALCSGKKIVYYDSINDCVEAVIDDKVDTTYVYTYGAQKAVFEDVKNRLVATVLPEYKMDFVIAVSNDMNYSMISILNKAIESVNEDTIQKIILKETNFANTSFSLMALIYDNPFMAISTIVILICIIFFIILIVIRNRNLTKDAIQSAQLERFMSYVCKANDMVIEVNLQNMTSQRYYYQDGKIESVNEPFLSHHFNNPNDSIFPEDYKALTDNLSEEMMDEMINSGGEKYFECRCKDNNGEYLWHSFTIQAITKDKLHPRNFILFKKNIDNVKKEDEAKKLALKDALQTAIDASEAKDSFMSRMSHEIRTPLNAVIGYMTLAKMSQDNIEKIYHCIDNSELAAKHLLNIINDVLDISAIENGKIKIAHEDFDLKHLLTTITTIFYSQAKDKMISFNILINNLSEEWVIGDSLRVNQILMNLLSNAIKFTPKSGKVTLEVNQVRLDDKDVFIKFKISDTGIGMSKEYMNRIFSPFEQESATTAQKFGGSGLGLSITKNLVTMMDGKIDVESVVEQGSTFTVMLTFARSSHSKEANIQHDFSKVRALIVDDEKNSCDYIKALLKRCGVRSDIVYDGMSAIKQINRRIDSDYAYDLCIMDWNMPNINGIETAKMIRKDCQVDLPIIIATAYDVSEIEDEALQAGVNKVIAKPLFQSTLFDLLLNTYGKYSPVIPDNFEKIDLNGIKILLVEDNEMNLEIAKDILEKSNIIVECASNGREAVDMFNSNYYDAILMDVMMPIMNGYEASKAIRNSKHERAKTIPIIAMTANAFSEDVSSAMLAGMNDHIAKPIDYNKLFSALKKYIKKEEGNNDE